MRNFIVSDLHGNGNAYSAIMAYLDNVSKDSNEEITLFINGDLIDRGPDSAYMLLDIKDRVLNNRGIKIEFLAGNHELLMYNASFNRKNGVWEDGNWFYNGGYMTAYGLELLSSQEENEIIEFISNLKIYHKFNETINDKNIDLVHAKCPDIVLDECDLKISSDINKINDLLWTRKNGSSVLIGNDKYFTIIGHTPVEDFKGYKYFSDENYLNIDGGCARYVNGFDNFNHIPLVEIDSINNRLIILTFNNNNEIISGSYLSDCITDMNCFELEKYRKYINNKVKIKKKYQKDGLILFE